MNRIRTNFEEISGRISRAAVLSGRKPEDISLIAVSKTKPYSDILQAYQAGLRSFGENRVQELTEKFSVKDHDDMCIHMIGNLQSNKVKDAVRCSDWIQSIERDKILKLVQRHAEELAKTIHVCIEVNTSGEQSKHGIHSRDQLHYLVESALHMPNLNLRGLMTIGPLMSEGEEEVRRAFVFLRELFEDVKARFKPPGWDCLSMGMSNDFELAIAEGATMVRVGTSLFGARG